MIISKLPAILCIASFFLLLGPSLLGIGLTLLLVALSIRITMCIMRLSWVSIAFFIVYVGGIIVIFSYFTSLSGSAKVGFNSFVFPLSIILILWIEPTPLIVHLSIPSVIYYLYIYLILISLIALLVAIIAVVYIARPQGGPLRGPRCAYLNYVIANHVVPSPVSL